jgi:hypothetical protein
MIAPYKPLPILFALIMAIVACGQQHYITKEQFADKLYAKKICSPENYQRLLTAIKEGKLDGELDFLNYCDKATVIHLKNYPEKPEDYLERIHRDVAGLLPELAFTDFQFQIVLDSAISDDDDKFYDFVVSLQSGGKTYKHRSSYYLDSVPRNEDAGEKIDQQEFYKIFNKVLADAQSPYRLHEVKTYKHGVDWENFGIIALTREQADMLHGGGVYFGPSYESFKSTSTSKRMDTAIAAYQKIGLLAHLSPEQIKLAKDKASQQENNHLNDVLQCFPNTIYFFDTELANLKDPYAEILNRLSRISKGAFKPDNIVDKFAAPGNKTALVKFTLNGKDYSKQLQVQDDWVDPSFFDLVNQAVTECKLNGQFCQLYTGGQEGSLIFLTTAQEKYLRANNLLVFADQWEMVEE